MTDEHKPKTQKPASDAQDTEPQKTFWHHFVKKYKLMFYNEAKEKVVFSFRMTTWVASLFFILQLGLTAVLVILVMTETPLRSYLPGYLDVEKRTSLVETGLRLDSLEEQSNRRSVYLANLTDILSGRVEVDSIVPFDSAEVVRFDDSIKVKSKREEMFMEAFEEQEKYSLNAVTADKALPGFLFITPVKGEVVSDETGRDVANPDLAYCRIRIAREMPVLAPLDGTVIAIDFIFDDEYKIALQHADNYVTVFTHLSQPFVEMGQFVKAGTAIAQAGRLMKKSNISSIQNKNASAAKQSEAEDRWIGLRIWHKGKAIDPMSVITF